ncbi:MAG: hypothetical protein JWO05_3589 [Gemmatimonadetes bacterium]|nr:hypothetical protein [Gemmatimonadota bacterium]
MIRSLLVLALAARTLTAQATPAAAHLAPMGSTATTASFGWLAGSWQGSFPGNPSLQSELIFQPPRSGVVTGIMRLFQGPQLLVVELISVVDGPRGPEMRFRHFSGDLGALETDFRQSMVLRAHADTLDTFENSVPFDAKLMSTQPRVSSWIHQGTSSLVARSDIINADGKPATLEVNYRRITP